MRLGRQKQGIKILLALTQLAPLLGGLPAYKLNLGIRVRSTATTRELEVELLEQLLRDMHLQSN